MDADNTLLPHLGQGGIEMVERLQLGALVAQHIALEPPGRRLGDLVSRMLARRDREHVVQLLEGALLGLGHEEEDQHEGGDVQTGVEGEGADRVEGTQDAREGDGEHGGPEEAGGHGPGHADLAVGQGEDFGGIGEGHGTLAGGVEGREEVDEEGDESQMRVRLLGDDEA